MNPEIILELTQKIEGKRTARTFTRQDAEAAIKAMQLVPPEINYLTIYAQRGAFVPNSYKWRAPITRVLCKRTNTDWQITVSVTDAKRSHGRGPWITQSKDGLSFRRLT